MTAATQLQLLGAAGFGAIIGWFAYYLNRYRKGDVQFSDITTLVGAVGGAGILALFPASTDLFGAYGIGLFAGFFGYFIVLTLMVAASKNFDADFFLDGRRKRPTADFYIPGENEPGGGQHPFAPQPSVVIIPPSSVDVVQPYRTMEALLAAGADIAALCRAEWPAGKADCNVFVKAVAGRVGVTLSGNADAILTQIRGAGWTSLGGDGVAASDAAKAGKLVIAGVSSTDLGDAHGHVVVVVPPTGPLAHGKYPYAYWGSLNASIREDGGKGTTLNYSFNATDRDKVFYAARSI